MFKRVVIGFFLCITLCSPAYGQDEELEGSNIIEDLDDFFDDEELQIIRDQLSFLYGDDLALQSDQDCEYNEITGEENCRKSPEIMRLPSFPIKSDTFCKNDECVYFDYQDEVWKKAFIACMTKTMTYHMEERYPNILLSNYC